MSEKRLTEIVERHAATTQGEWVRHVGPEPFHVANLDILCGDTHVIHAEEVDAPNTPSIPGWDRALLLGVRNAEFVAHAHQDIPWLLALIRDQQKLIDDLARDAGLLPQDAIPAEQARARAERLTGLLRDVSEICGRFVDRHPDEAHFDSYDTDHADARTLIGRVREELERDTD